MCKSLEEASFSLFLHFLFSVFPFPAFSLFASALLRALPRGVLAYQAWRIRNHEYVLIILKKKIMKERLRDFLLVKWDIPYKNLKILAGLWRSRNEILRSLENIVITRSIAIARLKCVSLTGILSRAICVAIVMEMLEVL